MFFSIRVGGYDRGEGVFSAVRILPTPYAIIVWILYFRCTRDFISLCTILTRLEYKDTNPVLRFLPGWWDLL